MKRYSPAFTIIEIIVVVVIIGIIAALSVVSYSEITRNARVASLKSDLARSASALKKQKAENGGYPTSGALATPLLVGSEGVTFSYLYDATTKTYCLNGTIQQEAYYIDVSHTEPQKGTCEASGFGGVPQITNVAYNPSVELDLSGVSAYLAPAEVIRVAGDAADGTYSASMTVPSSTIMGGIIHRIKSTGIVAGAQYTCSVSIKGTPGVHVVLSGRGYNAGGGLVSQYWGESEVAMTSSWQRVTSTFTVPANVTQIGIQAYLDAPTAGTFVKTDAIMCVQGAVGYDYRDGTFADWAWTGVPHASESTGIRP